MRTPCRLTILTALRACVRACTRRRYAMSLIGGTTSSASFVNLYERFGPTYANRESQPALCLIAVARRRRCCRVCAHSISPNSRENLLEPRLTRSTRSRPLSMRRYAGKYDEERGTYALGYPGLLFHFPIPQKYAADCLSRPGELPLEFPDGTTPVASRLCVFGGTLSDDAGSGSGSGSGGDVQGNGVALANTSLITKGLRYFEEVRVSLGEGGGLRFAGGARIGFGDSPQDVWTQLGAPGDTFHKPLGKMLLHSGAGDAEKGGAATTDYFYNYFTRGIDVLFDGASHRAKKFVLHSNQVGHPDFNVYVKCNFAVEVPADDNGRGGERAEADDMSDEEAFFASTSARADAEAHATANCDGPRIMGLIRADSTFNDVTRLVGDGGRATIHTQFISGSSSNPFGSTFIYGFRQRITLEVMKSGRIANITIF